MSKTIPELQKEAFNMAMFKGFWNVNPCHDVIPGKLMLIVTELAEALEEYRKDTTVNNVYSGEAGKPEGFGVELADAVIRIFDLAEAFNIDLDHLIQTKMAFNSTRPFKHGGKAI